MCVFVWGLDDRDLFFIIMWRLNIGRGKESVCVCVCLKGDLIFHHLEEKQNNQNTANLIFIQTYEQTYLAKDIPTLNNGETDY